MPRRTTWASGIRYCKPNLVKFITGSRGSEADGFSRDPLLLARTLLELQIHRVLTGSFKTHPAGRRRPLTAFGLRCAPRLPPYRLERHASKALEISSRMRDGPREAKGGEQA